VEFDELVDLARIRMDADRVPAVHLGLIDGEREWTAALGIRDVRLGRKADDRTLFRIASITKTFTATVLVRLAENGTVDLDAPVRHYVPELTLPDGESANRITTRQLLLHTSGWVPGEQSGPDGPNALADGARLQANGQQVSPPGAYFSYNGVGYMVAGRVIEVATGHAYEDVIRAMILAPLGMERTKFTTETDDDIAGDHTVRAGAAETLVDPTSGRWGLPSGGLRSTAFDMLRFARCHLGETDVLDPHQAAAMAESHVALPPPGESKALSWFVRDIGPERLLMHLGGALGQQSMLAVCPRRRFALVVLTNSAVGNGVTQAVLSRALRQFLDIGESAPPRVLFLERARLHEYDGRYTQPGSDLVLTPEEGGLSMRVVNTGPYAQRPTPPPAHLGFWGPDRVIGTTGWATGQYGDFLRDTEGRVGYFRWSGRARRRVEG
jgi:CubicO group peptidase (beta-lactamase class C family)